MLTFPQVVARLRSAGCVFAEDEANLLLSESQSADHLMIMVGRRETGEPLEYILGWARFCGLRVAVEPGVFVPRRRTEFLAQLAIGLVDPVEPPPVVIDLCCGSGAVGAAVLAARPAVHLFAADISAAAVVCARRNLPASRVFRGDLFLALPEILLGRSQIVLANAPYVPTPAISLMPPEARDYEPMSALDGGADGLDVQREVLATACRWLAPGGTLLVETSREQASGTMDLFSAAGLIPRLMRSEDLDATVVGGQLDHSTRGKAG